MTTYRISSNINKKEILKKIGSDIVGIDIMQKKMSLHFIFIKELKLEALIILKQDSLSVGADLATPRDAITCIDKLYDCMLIANTKQLELLCKKESIQPFGLKNLSNELKQYLSTKYFSPKIMGIINTNRDSFYEKSRFDDSNTISQIRQMIDDGANIIDIGGVSSKPNSIGVSKLEEIKRVRYTIQQIYQNKLYDKVIFSIDSSDEDVAKLALDNGFSMINDINGAKNDKLLEIVKQYKAKYILMHMQNNPKSMQDNPTYSNVIIEIEEFFKDRIKKLNSFGIEDIILDVGIGFGKKLKHNLALIKNLKNFEKFKLEILIGASRKSMINDIKSTLPEDRLPATLAIHQNALLNGASILRVHDVKEHSQMISVVEALSKTYYE